MSVDAMSELQKISEALLACEEEIAGAKRAAEAKDPRSKNNFAQIEARVNELEGRNDAVLTSELRDAKDEAKEIRRANRRKIEELLGVVEDFFKTGVAGAETAQQERPPRPQPQHGEAERRIAPDGGAYTRAEFLEYYDGSTAEWDAAGADAAPPQVAAAEPEQPDDIDKRAKLYMRTRSGRRPSWAGPRRPGTPRRGRRRSPCSAGSARPRRRTPTRSTTESPPLPFPGTNRLPFFPFPRPVHQQTDLVWY